jgi:hypothetical protein
MPRIVLRAIDSPSAFGISPQAGGAPYCCSLKRLNRLPILIICQFRKERTLTFRAPSALRIDAKRKHDHDRKERKIAQRDVPNDRCP